MVRTGKEAHSEEADRPGRAGTRPGCRVAQGAVGPRRTRPVDRGDDRGRVVGLGVARGARAVGQSGGVDRWLLCAVAHSYRPTKSARPTLGFGPRTAGVIARR